MVEYPPASAGDVGSIPGQGGSPGEGNGNPLRPISKHLITKLSKLNNKENLENTKRETTHQLTKKPQKENFCHQKTGRPEVTEMTQLKSVKNTPGNQEFYVQQNCPSKIKAKLRHPQVHQN